MRKKSLILGKNIVLKPVFIQRDYSKLRLIPHPLNGKDRRFKDAYIYVTQKQYEEWKIIQFA